MMVMPEVHLRNRQRWIEVLTSFVAALICTNAAAVDFPGATPPGMTAQIQGSELWSYDSNPLKLVQGGQSLTGSNTNIDLILGKNTKTSQFTLDSIVNQGIYNNSDYNSTDFHETLDMFKANLRWTAGLVGHVDYDTARTSEITSFGIAVPSIRHTGLSLAPTITFNPTSIDRLTLDSSVLKSTYDNVAFTDYNFYTASPSYAHNFNPMNAGILVFNMQRYATSEGPKVTVDSFGPSAGWTSVISQRFTSKITMGVEDVRQNDSSAVQSSSRFSYVFSANLTFKGQQDTTNFAASRVEQPFGNGSSSLLTSFNIDDAHALNERIVLKGAADYRFANYPALSGVNLNKEIGASTGLSYRLLEHLDATGTYRYLNQTLTGITGKITEQSIMIGLTYHPASGTL